MDVRMGVGCRVLLLEDHQDSRAIMTLLLQKAGYGVDVAGTVEEGIAKADGQAVALLDLCLPGGSGVRVFEHIRRQKHPMRVAFVTATADVEELRRILSPGDAIFSKPVDFDMLFEWLNR
jgi:DNA-binding response OmpR family regulator